MRTVIGRNGSVAVLAAAAAIVLLVFSINAANSTQRSDTTFTMMQAANETALKTENLVRILDRTTTDYLQGHFDGSCRPIINSDALRQQYTDSVTSFNAAADIACTISNVSPVSNGVTLSVTADLACITAMAGTSIMAEHSAAKGNALSFSKKWGGATPCDVNDSVSNCREYPNFECP